ncbi:MAG: MFS transporter [Candidatus Doudnabacteria bacterium]|nr:MFS transporter [Candidatus Doudnabacteria bacterium]
MSSNLRSYFEVLKNLNFTKLWISQITSQLTNYLLSFAVILKVFALTKSSVSVGILVFSFGLATVFFGALAGVYADRFDRKWLLTIINFLQAIAVAFYIPFIDNFWGLVVITFIYSSLNQFYLPAEAPSIPNLVEKKDLLVANSYFSFTGSFSLIVGFAIAGPLVSAFGPTSPFIAGFFLLLIATLATLLLPNLKAEDGGSKHLLENVWTEFKVGVEHFWNNEKLHFPLLSLLSIQLINGMLITIAPAFIVKMLGIELEKGSFLAILPLGLGVLAGALLLGVEDHRFTRVQLINLGFYGMGTTIFLLSFINNIPYPLFYYALIALGAGYFNAHIFAPSHSILQTYADSEMRGRVYGSLFVLQQAAATLPTILVGFFADILPLSAVIGSMGILLLVLGASLRPFRRHHLT